MKNLWVAAIVCVLGCDLREGEAEERREVSRAVERGAPAERIQEQLEDVGNAVASDHAEVERQLSRALDDLEVRVAMVRQQVAEGHREASVELEVQLVELSEAAVQLRQELASPSSRQHAELRQELEILQQRLDVITSTGRSENRVPRLPATGAPSSTLRSDSLR